MQLPTREQCFDIMKQRLPDRMISHAMTVNKIAMFVAQRFIEAGFSINLELLDRASLLHDIGKFETLGTDLDHHIRGKEIISELG
ncbi:HDIG domain-containing protein, partial [Candidatus Woesearchaeota archaeon]|nr:HDIG domain-containing protein [Candidatus Woesearchaeota archaeon]